VSSRGGRTSGTLVSGGEPQAAVSALSDQRVPVRGRIIGLAEG